MAKRVYGSSARSLSDPILTPRMVAIAALPLLAAACVFANVAAKATETLDCTALSAEAFGSLSETDGLEILASEVVAEGTALGGGQSAPLDHCAVTGMIDRYTGLEGKTFGITFELRLPDAWNGNFVHQFNGGADGRVVTALGRILSGDRSRNALSRGYAVVSSNAGHDGSLFPDDELAGEARFGLDPRARINYGYGAVAKLQPVAVAMTEAYYGQGVAYSYGIGSSNGGRHGMVAAARTPELFDGLLIGYPGYHLPKAAVQHAHDYQTLNALPGGIAEAFSAEDMQVLSAGILESCDALDGLADGVVGSLDACQRAFEVEDLICGEANAESCLREDQVEALKTLQAGPRNAAGEPLYATWIWDIGMASANYRGWKLAGNNPEAGNLPRIVLLGAPQLAQTFTTPPTPLEGTVESLETYLAEFDFDADAPKIFATDETYTESAYDFMVPPGADDPDLAAFRAAGGKAIVFHGGGDPVFSMVDTTAWYERLKRNTRGEAKRFVRYYQIPGMPHGGAGPYTDDFDFLTPLANWVENGEAPGAVVAGVSAGNAEGQAALGDITRKLCPYPRVARYFGGEEASAESFRCVRQSRWERPHWKTRVRSVIHRDR